MKENSVYSYYCFGYNYRILRTGFPDKKRDSVINFLKSNYLLYIENLSLPVTNEVITPMYAIIEEIKLLSPESEIDDELNEKIQKCISDADNTLDAELKLKKTYTLTPKRIDIDRLLKTPEDLLGQGVWIELSDQCHIDFNEACKCIAFNRTTAGAFHIMRAVEEMVRQLYFKYVKQNRMQNPMWGQMIEKLEKKKAPKPTTKTLEHLDMIRSTYRNPTQHPDKNYSIDEAQDLLYSSIVAINEIVSEIKNKS